MRLIDADELIVFGIDDPTNGGLFKFVPKEFIDDAPTIDAMPVEWVEEWYKKKGSKPFVADDVSVRLLLRDWREEHETD